MQLLKRKLRSFERHCIRQPKSLRRRAKAKVRHRKLLSQPRRPKEMREGMQKLKSLVYHGIGNALRIKFASFLHMF